MSKLLTALALFGSIAYAAVTYGPAAAPPVTNLMGRAVEGAAPSDGEVMTWSTSNNQWEAVTPAGGSSLTGANGEVISNAVDDVFRVASDDASIVWDVFSPNATNGDAIVRLSADNSADNGDDWQIKHTGSGNLLEIQNDTSGAQATKLSLSTAGVLTLTSSLTLSDGEVLNNPSDDLVRIASNDDHFIFDVYSPNTSNGNAIIRLTADDSADNGDEWQIKHLGTDNSLEFQNDTTGSQATKIAMGPTGKFRVGGDIATMVNAKMEVDAGTAAAGVTSFLIRGASGTGSAVRIDNMDGYTVLQGLNYNNSAEMPIIFQKDNEDVGIGNLTDPQAQLHTTGTVRFASLAGAGALQADAEGDIVAVSDERLKNIQGSFDRGIEALLNIKPIQYRMKDEQVPWLYTGFGAHNVAETLPEAVAERADGYLMLNDRVIIAALVNAVKELDARCPQSTESKKTIALSKVRKVRKNQGNK